MRICIVISIEFALHLLLIVLVITSEMLIHKRSGTVSALLLGRIVMVAVAISVVTRLRMRI